MERPAWPVKPRRVRQGDGHGWGRCDRGGAVENPPSVAVAPATSSSPLIARRGRALSGRVRVPGDKSISHRALILASLALGRSEIEGLLEGADVLATARACAALGATVERRGEGRWDVHGVGVGALLPPRRALDFGNAGTGARLMMGVVAGHDITTSFDGDASLRSRPMARVLDPLRRMGTVVVEAAPGARLPLTLRGTGQPVPIRYEVPVPSAQVKSAVLLAGLNSPGDTTVVEREATRDHTESLLTLFGASVTREPHGATGHAITLRGRPTLESSRVAVPADPSSAAFPTVAALLVPGSDIVLEGVMMNPLRSGLVATLREMGARIETLAERLEGGEIVADLRVRAGPLQGVDVAAARAPAMIDEYPILAVAAACATGQSRLRGLAELRVKESDRLTAIATGLAAVGATVTVEGDDLLIQGGGAPPGGAVVATGMDHRIAMSFLVMGLATARPVTIDDGGMIATSFPEFAALMAGLGAEIGPA